MKKYETETEKKSRQVDMRRICASAGRRRAGLGSERDDSEEIQAVHNVGTQDIRQNQKLTFQTMRYYWIFDGSPVMEKLLKVPDLVTENICPSLPVECGRVNVGDILEHDSVLDGRALLHLVYRVKSIGKRCVVRVILEDFKIM